jgi:hypothetical protein
LPMFSIASSQEKAMLNLCGIECGADNITP